MIVFEYFYDKRDVFGPKMKDVADKDDPEEEEVCLSLCLLVSLSFYLFVHLFVSLSIKLPACLSAFQSDCNKPVFVYNYSHTPNCSYLPHLGVCTLVSFP